MNLRRLQHFEAVYRLRSFARAADELALTQSALSRSLQKLEGELGTVLFDRTTHYVQPTEAAERLIRSALDVIAAAATLAGEAAALQRPASGTVRLGAGPYPLHPLIGRAIGAFSRSHPGVRVSVVGGGTEALLRGLVDRALDVVVCDMTKFDRSAYAGEVIVSALPSEPLMLVTAAGHPLAQGTVRRREAANYPWALPRPSPGSETRLAPALRSRLAAGSFPDYELDSTAACLAVVCDGVAVTVVPRSLALEACRDGTLAALALPPADRTNDGIHLLRNRTQSPAVASFLTVLREAAGMLGTTDFSPLRGGGEGGES